ncbi:MAG: ATP-binding protein [Methanoregula sp.]
MPDSARVSPTTLTALCGAATIFIAILGLLGIALGNTVIAGLAPGYKTVSFFAALCWIVLGIVLITHAIRPLTGYVRTGAAVVCAAVALAGALELPLTLRGTHSFPDILAVQAGDLLLAHSTTHVSTLIAGIIIPIAIGVLLILYSTEYHERYTKILSVVGITGLCVFLVGLTLMISYAYGAPVLYNTAVTPTSYISALAACFMGAGLVSAAGSGALPLMLFSGSSTRARLLRTFVPLIIIILFIEELIGGLIENIYHVSNSLTLAISLVLFLIVTVYVVARASQGLGDALDSAENELVTKNDELHAAYESVTLSEEELRQQYDELAKSQDELRESTRRLLEAQEMAHLGFWTWDIKTGCVEWADEVFRIFGLDPESFTPQIDSILALSPWPEEQQRGRELIQRATESHSRSTYEQRFLRPDKSIGYYHSTFEGRYDHAGKLVSIVGTVLDITGRKKAEIALRLANQKLQLMNIVAWHDIQNKVTSLRGYIELSRDMVADETVKKMLKTEEDILMVIHQQLEYTREYQQIGAKPSEWVDISSMLAMVLAMKSIRSVRVLTEVAGLFIYGDPILEKVFSHLIENTLVHAKTATEIRIHYRETTEGLVLMYEDNGLGIPVAEKKNFFVRTFASKHFGLFFIHDILELSGITLVENGEPGKGARFEMTIPHGMYRLPPPPGRDA